jgi:nitroreductase
MEFSQVVARRRMVRSFEDRPIPEATLERILGMAGRAPSAGYTQGTELLVLEGRAQTEPFWAMTLDPEFRARRARRGVENAPVIVLPFAHRQAYLDRYAEPDKAHLDMGHEAAWPVPYWEVDAAFATLLMLLTAVDEGIGALFFGVFRRHRQLCSALGVPEGHDLLGAVALGWPAADDMPSPSLARGRRPATEVVHRGHW